MVVTSFQVAVTAWVLVFATLTESLMVSPMDIMKCSYGERGSLTATCVNANASYFRTTPYRFDQLDETLRCVNCTLKILETATFDISGNQIRNLDLRSSHIESMKEKAFVGLIFLEALKLSYNNIRSVYPGTFNGVQKITVIDLSHNKINILSDDGFLELLNLEVLNLEYNEIQTISNHAFKGLSKLTILNLNTNKISEIKDIFSQNNSLSVLNLANNNIGTLKGPEFTNLTMLLSLDLSHNKINNPLIEMPHENQLRKLLLHHNNIDVMSANFLKGLFNLEDLDLSFNHIKDLQQKVLQNLHHLANLNLPYNNLDSIQTGVFSGLPHLEFLNVSNNRIRQIEITGVFSLHSIHNLDLSNNSLRDLDYTRLISRLPRLSYLKLDKNLLPCALEDEMAAYFAEDNFKFVFYEPVVGTIKCIDTPMKKSKVLVDTLLEEESSSHDISGAQITIFVLISLQFACISFLLFLQYRSYINSRFSGYSNRSTSSTNLVAPEPDNREAGEFLRE